MSVIDKVNTNSWFLIANPTSGNGSFTKKWKEIQQLLKQQNLNYSFAFTQYSKHEIELVQIAIQKGFRHIISVGGDGTLHHIVNGIMLQIYVKTSDITIGVIPIGTGNDWIKTYNIPTNLKKAVKIINKKNTVLQDIGVLQTTKKTSTYFTNVAGLGYDGYVVNKLKRFKKLGSVGYLLAGIYGLLSYKKTFLKIILNDKVIETKCLMTVFGICKYSGGGMQFTKDVNPTDGLLDVTIAKNLSFFDLVFNVSKLYSGNIVDHKKVATYKTKEILVIPKEHKPFIQADGELIGTGEVSVKIIEKAIAFVVL